MRDAVAAKVTSMIHTVKLGFRHAVTQVDGGEGQIAHGSRHLKTDKASLRLLCDLPVARRSEHRSG